MNIKGQIKLDYTEDFRIACRINNLKFEELLQYFIDHVSFYAFIGGDMEPVYLWATIVSINCREAEGGAVETVTDGNIQRISMIYIKKLTALLLEKGLSKNIETVRSIALMEKWAAEMLPLTDYPDEVETDSGLSLKLRFDFNMLCRMNGLDVQQLLQYFINTISLARERAINLLVEVRADPGTSVLLFLVSYHDEVKNKILPQQDIYKQYGLKLLRLDKKQKEEADLDTRIKNYRAFYLDWYNALGEKGD